MIHIDGSHGEGGGQILRTALSLAAIIGLDVEISSIRAGRRRPGLMAQHLTGARAVAEITQGELEGAALGSQEITFRPGRIAGGRYRFDVSEARASAGSTGMIFQSIAPVLAFAEAPSEVILKGGTHTEWAPPTDYLKDVFLPTVSGMGLDAELRTETWGWYPVGGGTVRVHVHPLHALRPLDLSERGDLVALTGCSVVSDLPLSIARRQRLQLRKRLNENGLDAKIELLDAPSSGKGTFVFLLARFEHIVAGFSSLGSKGLPAERVADQAADEFLAYIASNGATDPHLADQLILYMALAEGCSRFTTSQVSQHLLTNLWVTEQLIPAAFNVEGKIGEQGQIVVEGIDHRSG